MLFSWSRDCGALAGISGVSFRGLVLASLVSGMGLLAPLVVDMGQQSRQTKCKKNTPVLIIFQNMKDPIEAGGITNTNVRTHPSNVSAATPHTVPRVRATRERERPNGVSW